MHPYYLLNMHLCTESYRYYYLQSFTKICNFVLNINCGYLQYFKNIHYTQKKLYKTWFLSWKLLLFIELYKACNFTKHATKDFKKTCIFVLRVIIIYEILQNMHCCHEISIIHETLTKHDFCPDIIVFIIIRTLKTNIVSLSFVSFLSLYLIHLVLTKVLPNFLPLSMFP